MIANRTIWHVLSLGILFFCAFHPAHAQRFGDLNRRLNSIDRNQFTAHQRTEIPPEVQAAQAQLAEVGIPWIANYPALATTDPAMTVIHEHMRSRLVDGMQWLPLSWSHEADGHDNAEEWLPSLVASLNQNLPALLASIPAPDRNAESGFILAWTHALHWIPHNGNTTLINAVRAEAAIHAGNFTDFFSIRLEIHQEPSWLTVARAEAYLQTHPAEAAPVGSIITGLRAILGGASDAETVCTNQPGLCARVRQALEAAQQVIPPGDAGRAMITSQIESLEALGLVAQQQRTSLRAQAGIVATLETIRALNAIGFTISNGLHSRMQAAHLDCSLAEALRWIKALLDIADAGGWLRQEAVALRQAYTGALRTNAAQPVTALDQGLLRRLVNHSVEAASGGHTQVQGVFGRAVASFREFTNAAPNAFDELVRSSVLIPLDNRIQSLRNALPQLSSTGVFRVNGQASQLTYNALNIGLARGVLRDLTDSTGVVDPNTIAFYRHTPPDLPRVSGVMTCDAGGTLSHVQMLAHNLGLPNVWLNCEASLPFTSLINQEVYFGVLPNGEVLIQSTQNAPPNLSSVYVEFARPQAHHQITLQVPNRLDIHDMLPLHMLRFNMRGQVAGGKACGLGELSHIMEGHPLGSLVPQGYVLPFGVYYQHMTESNTLRRIRRVLQDPLVRGNSPASQQARQRALAQIREAIQNVELKPELILALHSALNQPQWHNQGVFVRSDTNAEDLQGFSGAGLNTTVENIRLRPLSGNPGVMDIQPVIQAIKRVWASPFSERSFSWREDLIRNPWDIFPSVVVQLAVPSTKSGVLVVGSPSREADINNEVFISSNHGVGSSVVDGVLGAEEIRVFRTETPIRIERVREAVANTRRLFDFWNGGTSVERLPNGFPQQVLSDTEATLMASLGERVQTWMRQTYGVFQKWDIEWGWWEDLPVLFQMRPFIGRRAVSNPALLSRLATRAEQNNTGGRVLLNQRVRMR